MYLVLLPILGLFRTKCNGYDEILEVKKSNFPTDGPIPEKQGRVWGNKNICKVRRSRPTERLMHLLSNFSLNNG